jgi:hypothetical protein
MDEVWSLSIYSLEEDRISLPLTVSSYIDVAEAANG